MNWHQALVIAILAGATVCSEPKPSLAQSPPPSSQVKLTGGGIDITAQYLSGLESLNEVLIVRTGSGGTITTTKDPGLLSLLDLTLTRTRLPRDKSVLQWRDAAVNKAKAGFKKDVVVDFLDSQGNPAMIQFTLTAAWPSKYAASSFVVGSQVLERETFTLVFEDVVRTR